MTFSAILGESLSSPSSTMSGHLFDLKARGRWAPHKLSLDAEMRQTGWTTIFPSYAKVYICPATSFLSVRTTILPQSSFISRMEPPLIFLIPTHSPPGSAPVLLPHPPRPQRRIPFEVTELTSSSDFGGKAYMTSQKCKEIYQLLGSYKD